MLHIIKIDDLSIPELNVYTSASEIQLFRCNEPAPGMFIAESAKVIERAMDAGYEPVSFLADIKYLREYDASPDPSVHPHAAHIMNILKRGEGFPVYIAESEVLDGLTGFHLTNGLVCAMRRRVLPPPDEILDGASRVAFLENITNPTNVGAIFRSAAALNMDAVLLNRSCADPLYRRAIRVSMGTVFQIPWTVFGKRTSYPHGAMEQLRSLGFRTAAMVLDKDSVRLDDENLKSEKKLVILLGAEGDGLSPETVADCDYKVMIPMSHGVDSLNVAAASAVAFWELGNR